MFSLFKGWWSYMFSKTELHVLIIGLDYAGKTTLLEQLKTMFGKKPGIPLDKIPPTVGLNIARVNIKYCKIIFWDLGGQERLRTLWSKYYKESQGLVFLVDSADPSRFEEAKTTLENLQKNPDLEGIPILVLANKQDLDEAMTAKEVSSRLEIESYDAQPCLVQPISALNRDGVHDAIIWLIDQIKASERYHNRETTGS